MGEPLAEPGAVLENHAEQTVAYAEIVCMEDAVVERCAAQIAVGSVDDVRTLVQIAVAAEVLALVAQTDVVVAGSAKILV